MYLQRFIQPAVLMTDAPAPKTRAGAASGSVTWWPMPGEVAGGGSSHCPTMQERAL